MTTPRRRWTRPGSWRAIEQVCPREQLAEAVAEVDRLTVGVTNPGGEDEAWRAQLLSRFGTVRPFLALLSEVIPFGATRPARRCWRR